MESKKKKKQQNLYYLLGVTKDADTAAIKSAYKKLALKWHPDKNQGSEEATEMFKSISEAYAILSNPQRRKRYDLYGETSQDDGGDMFSGDDWMFGGMGMDEDFDDFINLLEQDNLNSFASMFRGLGKNYRTGTKNKGGFRSKAAKQAKVGKGRGEEEMFGDMMSMMMMEGMMAMGLDEADLDDLGMGGKKGKKNGNDKKKKNKDSSDGEWETIEQNGKAVDKETTDKTEATNTKKAGEDDDDGWETESD